MGSALRSLLTVSKWHSSSKILTIPIDVVTESAWGTLCTLRALIQDLNLWFSPGLVQNFNSFL